MYNMEGFQYATALDLNTGYYTIIFFPTSQYMKTIVTKFQKLIYNNIPIDMCSLVDTFKSKVDKLLSDIDGVKKYIDDMLILIKYCLKITQNN